MSNETAQGSCFPVAKSFVTTEPLARLIEEAYGLEDAQCQLIQASMRDVYLVASSQKPYVFFIYRHAQRTADEITAEWDFVDYLKAGGAPVAPAVLQKSGELLLPIHAPEGIRYAVLGVFADGKHLRDRYSLESVRRYGWAIAQIHIIADTLPHPPARHNNDFEFIVGQSLAALEPIMTHRSTDMAYLREVSANLERRFAALPLCKPEYGMIHGDVIRANAQVSLTGDVTVLDFDLCGWGWRAYDVSSYLQVAETEEAKQAFLNGYQELRPMTDDELGWLPLFETARHIFELGVPAMNIDHWGRACLTDGMIDGTLDNLRRTLKAMQAPDQPRPIGLCAGEFVTPHEFDVPLPADIVDVFEDRRL